MRYMTLHKIKTVCIVALSNYDVKDKKLFTFIIFRLNVLKQLFLKF